MVCQGYSGNRQQADDMDSIAQSYEERLQELYDRWNLWRQTGTLEAELSDGIYSVSYTHLDVYKRQVLWVRIWITGSFSSNQISVVFSCFVSPVFINAPFRAPVTQ